MKLNKSSVTKAFLVNVARMLFAQKGKDNVTMNDIAVNSGKSRRTLYTYFNNKHEVYLAVIENELDILIEKLQEVMAMRIPPLKKIETYIFTHFDAIKEAVNRNGSLKADFFKNIYEVEKARRSIDLKEIRMIKEILDEGIADGTFKNISSKWTSMIMLYALKGVEAPYLNNIIGIHIKERQPQIMNVFLNGLLKNAEN